jgi:tRNA dimethylallyltransferase
MHAATEKGRVPLLVGGTMLYFNALQHGLSQLPEANQDVRAEIEAEAATHGWPAMHAQLAKIDPAVAAKIQPNDAQRIERALEVYRISGQSMSALRAQSSKHELPFNILKIALMPSERAVLHQRIADRFQLMLAQGFIEEVQLLLALYPQLTADSPSMRCVGYRQTLAYLNGEIDLKTLGEQGVFATRQLAKRQLTWLRGMSDVQVLDCLSNSWINELAIKIRASYLDYS